MARIFRHNGTLVRMPSPNTGDGIEDQMVAWRRQLLHDRWHDSDFVNRLCDARILARDSARQTLGIEWLLDILNIQGDKAVARLASALGALALPLNPEKGKIDDITEELVKTLPDTLDDDIVLTVQRHVSNALPFLTLELQRKLHRTLELYPNWTFEKDGSVDRAPKVAYDDDRAITFSPEQLHAVRHILFAHLPVPTRLEDVLAQRKVLLDDSLSIRKQPRGAPPCCIVTVGPLGSGKSYLLTEQTSKLDDIIKQNLGAAFPAPPLSSFVTLDPDQVLHDISGETFQPTWRPYGNFINHENFAVAVARRAPIIFDGSAKDPLNICGRVISRLREAGYRVLFLVVLTSYQIARQRADERAKTTLRTTDDKFMRLVYDALQTALPVYLNALGPKRAADGALVFTNLKDNPELELEHTLTATSSCGDRDKAIKRAAALLTLP